MTLKRYLLLTVLLLATGCGHTVGHYSSSVVTYLYPDRDRIVEKAAVPELALPIKVGVAFVPTAGQSAGSMTGRWNWLSTPGSSDLATGLTEDDKASLLETISQRFEALPFVHDITIIPSAYLVSKGSFANLDQLQSLFGIDVIVLVSFDQVQFTDEGMMSITYWTLIGAYVVPGEKNATHTMVDATVYDIRSRCMLLRAPGVSLLKSRATPVNLSEQLRLDRAAGFNDAFDDLNANLEREVDRFRKKIEKHPETVRLTTRSGYAGAGSIGGGVGLVCLLLVGIGWWSDRRRTS